LVSVGTEIIPFDRLIAWAEYAAKVPGISWFVQHGHSRAPSDLPAAPFVDHADLGRLLTEAAVVVCHGGPSTIVESLRHGVVPLVVPRDPTLGEHVDDHQIRFVRRMAEEGSIVVVRTQDELAGHVAAAVDDPRHFRREPVDSGNVQASALRFGELVDALFDVPSRRSSSPLHTTEG
jgi:UDP-N-acetylglucosamine transferase subunit ALG13